MQFHMLIDGQQFLLDSAAVSCIRYRAEHGKSIITHLQSCETAEAFEGRLLRMCHAMISGTDRPELPVFAKAARRDRAFIRKACAARDALLADDPQRKAMKPPESTEPFDEYLVLALMAAAGLDFALIYELPIMHLVSVVLRCFEAKNKDQETYRPLTEQEMAAIYPR